MVDKFIKLIKDQLGCGYVWGSQGEFLTEEKLQQFISRHGEKHYKNSSYDASKWIGKTVYDCSGIIVWALTQLNLLTGDYTAGGLYRKWCNPINKSQLQVGDLVFRNDAHVGVYVGNGQVIHARGTKYGVVQTELFDSFNKFGRLKFFDSIEKQVKDFQKTYDLIVDGIIGKQTAAQVNRIKSVIDIVLQKSNHADELNVVDNKQQYEELNNKYKTIVELYEKQKKENKALLTQIKELKVKSIDNVIKKIIKIFMKNKED